MKDILTAAEFVTESRDTLRSPALEVIANIHKRFQRPLVIQPPLQMKEREPQSYRAQDCQEGANVYLIRLCDF